jgi:hypothetical protein
VTIPIARFATTRAVAYCVLCFALVGACLTFFTYLILGGSDFVRTHGVVWLFFLVIGWIAGVVALLLVLTVLRLIVFSDSLAVWTNEDDIIYVSKRLVSARKDQIASVSLGAFGRSDTPAVVLRLQDGSAEFIPVGLLSEEPSIIVKRLQAAIAT